MNPNRLPILIPCLLAALCLLPAQPAAKQLYDYTDENGIRHFTDTPPQTEQPVRSTRIQVENQPLVRLETQRGDSESVVIAQNLSAGPIEVELSFDYAENAASQPPLPTRVVIASLARQQLASIRQADRHQATAFRIVAEAVPGDPRTTPDRAHPYRLPFASGTRYHISQAFGGSFSHTDAQNFHAVDFGVEEGTPILAARDGVVVQVERDFFESGADRQRLAARANYVRVQHEDGSMALYAHLAFESVLVRPGSVVLAGQKLGEAGATGFATGPHLHFAIQRNAGMRLESIPFQFSGDDGPYTPQRGRTWLHAP